MDAMEPQGPAPGPPPVGVVAAAAGVGHAGTPSPGGDEAAAESNPKGRRILRWVQAVLGTSALVLVINLFNGVLTARVMGPSLKGLYNAMTTWPAVFASLSSVGIPAAFTSMYARAEANDRRQLVRVALGLSLAWGCLWGAACAVLSPRLLSHLGPGVRPWLLMGSGLTTIVTFNLVCNSILYLHERFRWSNWANVLRTLTIMLCLVGLAILHRLTPYAQLVVVWGTSLLFSAPIVALALQLYGKMPQAKATRSGTAVVIRLSVLGFGFYAIGLASLFNAQLDTMLSQAWLSARDIGLYAVATSSTTVVGMISGAFGQVFFPMVAADRPNEISRRTTLAFRRGLPVLLAAMGVLLVLARPILLVYGVRYLAAWPAVVTLAPVAVLGGAIGILYQGCFAVRDFLTPAVGEVVGAVSGAVLLWLLIPRWGLPGAGIAGSLSYLLDFLCVVALWGRRHAGSLGSMVPRRSDLRAVADLSRSEAHRHWSRLTTRVMRMVHG